MAKRHPHQTAGRPDRRAGTIGSAFGMVPMIRDFWHFVHHVVELLHFVRGALFGLLLVLLLCSVLLVLAEGMAIGEALYLTAITALTIGYGDITPTTAVGQIVCVVIGFVGVIWVGINVAVANRALAQAYQAKRPRKTTPPGDEG